MRKRSTRKINNLIKLLSVKEWTQRELARRTGLSESYASRVCLGYHRPNVLLAIKIARALDTTVEAIWGEGDQK